MKYLVLLTPTAGKQPADFTPYAVIEMQAVWNDYKKGSLREIYFSPSPLIISLIISLIYEAEGISEVDAAVKKLPMVELGLLSVQIIHLGPMHSFEVLFTPAEA